MRKIPKNHILIVVDTLKMGGSARQASQLAISLTKKNFYVDIFFYKHNFNDIFYKEILLNKYINVFYLQKPKFKNGFSLELLFNIFKLIKNNDYRTLISFQFNPTIYLALAAFFNPRKRCKKIFSLRNSPSLISNNKFFIIFLLTLYFNKLVLNSNKLRNCLVSRNSLFSNFFIKNTITIMNGYSKIVSYVSLNIRKKPSRILILARVHPVKGGIRFAKALKLFLHRNNKSISIKWAGTKEDNCLSNLEYQTINNIINSSSRLKKSWDWVGQIEDVDSLYKWTDVVIVPSSSEGMSNVVCEALCRGKFIICSDVGDYEFLIGKNKGIVYRNSSAESLCEALEKFFEIGHNKRTEISKNGLTFAKGNLLLEGTTNKYIELF